MKLRWVVPLLALLVGALLALFWPNRFGDTGNAADRMREEHVAPPPAGSDPPAPAAQDSGPTLAGDATDLGGTPRASAGTAAAPDPEPPEETAVEAVATYVGEVPTGWHEAPPAQRPHAIRPPRPRGPAMGTGGSSGGVGPTGHWSRFPPAGPPRGDASLRVVVTDASSARVAGAYVYLGPPASLHQEAVSFGDLRRLGTTDAHGELLASDLPAGAAMLAANLANQLNGPRGLDARSSIPVLLLSRATVHADLALPLDTGAIGAVEGRVIDEQQRPIARAEIRCGFLRTYADGEGRFTLPHVPAAPQTLTARRNGYAMGRAEVEVPRGGSGEVEIVLAWAEQGTLRLEGRVLTAAGAGLPGAALYLIDVAGRGTLRSTTSSDEGRYAFEALPERLRSTALRVQAGNHREGYAATQVQLTEGLTTDVLDIRLPPRQVRARFLLTDAGSGSPIDRCRVEVERLDDAAASPRGFTGRREDGIFEHYYPAGRYRFGVEAPDRETQIVEADLTPPGGEVDLAVAFPSARAPAVEVTVRVTVRDLATDAPVTECSILVLDAKGTEVARFVGGAPEGHYSLPAPSGPRTLRVSAPGYETSEEAVDLPAEPPVAEFVSYLAPR